MNTDKSAPAPTGASGLATLLNCGEAFSPHRTGGLRCSARKSSERGRLRSSGLRCGRSSCGRLRRSRLWSAAESASSLSEAAFSATAPLPSLRLLSAAALSIAALSAASYTAAASATFAASRGPNTSGVATWLSSGCAGASLPPCSSCILQWPLVFVISSRPPLSTRWSRRLAARSCFSAELAARCGSRRLLRGRTSRRLRRIRSERLDRRRRWRLASPGPARCRASA